MNNIDLLKQIDNMEKLLNNISSVLLIMKSELNHNKINYDLDDYLRIGGLCEVCISRDCKKCNYIK